MMAVLLAPLFMALVAVSVINVGLTAIGHSLEADNESLQWVISGYALTFGLFLVPAGRLGDATGRRRMLLIGIVVFTLGSLLAGLAGSIELLNVARVVQGIGSGLLNPQTIGLIQLHFRGQSRAKAFALLGTTVAVATAIGPVLGGLLIQVLGEDAGWRWMFLINVPIGIAAVLAGLRWVPDDRARKGAGRPDLDPVGTLLLAVAILAVMLPFLERSASRLTWLGIPLGLALVLAWSAWESRYKERGRQPMVDLAVFASPAFRNGILIISIYFMGSTSIWIIVPLYLQQHLGHTAFEASLLGLPSAVCAAVSAQIGGRYVLRLGRRLVIGGFTTVLIGLGLVAVVVEFVDSGSLPYWVLALPLMLVGISQGMTISPNQTLTLNSVDPRFGGVAGGVLQLGQRLGAAVGTAMIPGLLFSLTENGASWLMSFTLALVAIMVLTVAALFVCVHDRQREKAMADG